MPTKNPGPDYLDDAPIFDEYGTPVERQAEEKTTAVTEMKTTGVAAIRSAVAALYDPLRPEIEAMAEKWRDVAFDVSTTKGMNEAKKARQDLRENGRFRLQNIRDEAKKELNAAKKVIEEGAESLIKIIRPHEDAIDSQITAEETRKAEEKRKAEELAAAQMAKAREIIAGMSAAIIAARSLGSAEIEASLASVRDAVFDVDLVGLQGLDSCESTRAMAIPQLEALLEAAKVREEEARIKADEVARQAEENRELARKLEEANRLLAEMRQQAEDAKAAAQKTGDDADKARQDDASTQCAEDGEPQAPPTAPRAVSLGGVARPTAFFLGAVADEAGQQGGAAVASDTPAAPAAPAPAPAPAAPAAPATQEDAFKDEIQPARQKVVEEKLRANRRNGPTDMQILVAVAGYFDMTAPEALARMAAIDLDALKAEIGGEQ